MATFKPLSGDDKGFDIRPNAILPTGDSSTRDRGMIDSLMEQQQDELMKLRELVGMLSDRVAPVMGPDRSEDGLESSDAMPNCSPLAGQVMGQTETIQSIQQRVRQIIDRVEL